MDSKKRTWNNKEMLELSTPDNDFEFMAIVKELRIVFNTENVVVLNSMRIPIFVKFILCLGAKFSFNRDHLDEKSMDVLYGQCYRIMNEVNQFVDWTELRGGLRKMMKEMGNKGIHDNATIFINKQYERGKEGHISKCWWQKDCSVKQILNVHSFHPKQMKKNVLNEFIRHAIDVTSPDSLKLAVKRIKITLSRSSYPPNFISKLIREVFIKHGKLVTTSVVGDPDNNVKCHLEIAMRERHYTCLTSDWIGKINATKKHGPANGQNNIKYIPVPFVGKSFLNDVKNIMSKYHIRCGVAPVPVITNKKNLFSPLKDKYKWACMKFAIFEVHYMDCDFVQKACAKNLDIERTMRHMIADQRNTVFSHLFKNPEHRLYKNPKFVKRFNNRRSVDRMFGPKIIRI